MVQLVVGGVESEAGHAPHAGGGQLDTQVDALSLDHDGEGLQRLYGHHRVLMSGGMQQFNLTA